MFSNELEMIFNEEYHKELEDILNSLKSNIETKESVK